MNRTNTVARMLRDGSLVDVLNEGSERPIASQPMKVMTDAEIEAAAHGDPDARPMTPQQMSTARRLPRVRTMRRAFGMTQEKFASWYNIPLGTLRDWEQGRSEPDQPARAYLTVIARDPDAVARALSAFQPC